MAKCLDSESFTIISADNIDFKHSYTRVSKNSGTVRPYRLCNHYHHYPFNQYQMKFCNSTTLHPTAVWMLQEKDLLNLNYLHQKSRGLLHLPIELKVRLLTAPPRNLVRRFRHVRLHLLLRRFQRVWLHLILRRFRRVRLLLLLRRFRRVRLLLLPRRFRLVRLLLLLRRFRRVRLLLLLRRFRRVRLLLLLRRFRRIRLLFLLRRF